MSPGGMALIAPVCGNVGDRVIAYVDHLGRLEGKIARMLQNGFAMTISATPRKRDKLAAQLTWLANRSILNLPEDRRHGRFVPTVVAARLIMPNGTNIGIRIIDLSLSGAGIAHQHRPEVGSLVTLGKIPGRRGAPSGRRLRDGVHAAAAPGLPSKRTPSRSKRTLSSKTGSRRPSGAASVSARPLRPPAIAPIRINLQPPRPAPVARARCDRTH